MRKLAFMAIITIIILASVPVGVTAQQGDLEPAHLVLSVDNGIDARLNRMDWDVNAWAPLFPAMGVRSSDYIELAGRTTVMVLCSDLTLLDQRGSEVPRCDPYASETFFFYLDDPTWTPDESTEVVVSSADPASFPPEIRDPGAHNLRELSDSERSDIAAQVDTILGLGLSSDAEAFALSSLFRSYGMLFDAIGTLTALPDLQCTERNRTAEITSSDQRTLTESPALYVRLGELYQMIGQNEDANRSYECAVALGESAGDPANTALAYARLANISEDTAEATQLYQLSINNYAMLLAINDANAVLEVCGLRNCTLPQ